MLKALMLRKKIDDFKKALAEIREKQAAFSTRESELETAIQEAVTDEERATVETAVNEFEGEKADLEAQAADLETKIQDAETELAAVEEKTQERKTEKPTEGRKDNFTMNTRGKFFGMTMEQRTAFFERGDVKDFLTNFRELARTKRSVQGAELNIPDVMLDLIREKIEETSKLMKHLRVKKSKGKGRQNTMGTVPEAVWTEAVAYINELEFKFSQTEVDGYKVAGYVAIANSTLEDSDVNLGSEIMVGLGMSIGKAIDKACVYGTGIRMPLGGVTRLAQTTKPTDYPPNERPWENLSTTHIQKFDGNNLKSEKFFAKILELTAVANGEYSLSGETFWVMNRRTFAKIAGKAITANSAGIYVSQDDKRMPVEGGEIEICEFMSDGDVFGGYGDLYLLSDRKQTTIKEFEQTLALKDEMLFVGTARYDGKPAIADAFIAFNIDNKAVTTSATFAQDKANTTEAAG